MNRRPTILVAKGLLAFTTLVLVQPVVRAGCEGCASSSSHFRATRRLGCDTCPYRPGPSPTLINSDTFGFSPTVWSLWPGPADPNTSYPAATSAEPIKTPPPPPGGAEPSDKPAPPPMPPKSEKPPEQPKSPYAALPKR